MVSKQWLFMWPEHCNCFYVVVTHDCMSSIFEVLFLFWLVVITLLSSWDEMDVRVELLAGDIWASEYDKIGFLSVGVDIFDELYLKKRPISLPMVKISTIKQIYEKWGYVRKLNKIEIC